MGTDGPHEIGVPLFCDPDHGLIRPQRSNSEPLDHAARIALILCFSLATAITVGFNSNGRSRLCRKV
jgi:hypothetical protein